MCRFVSVITEEISDFGLVLKEGPRSLARLSRRHPDGWGIATHGGDDTGQPPCSEGTGHDDRWRIQKGTGRAVSCGRFQSIASRSSGTILIAHVRQKTVGATSIANAHPFMQSGWVFAHNGTIKDLRFVRARTSAARLSEVQGETDSEVLFAYLLTRLDELGLASMSSMNSGANRSARDEATRVLATAMEELRSRNIGALNFLLADGASCFVHRFGRTLFLLEGGPEEAREGHTPNSTRALKWKQRRNAVLVASERLTDDPWRELPEGTFFRVDREPAPSIAWPAAPARAAA
jgi:predicted glutamine amidotransferase